MRAYFKFEWQQFITNKKNLALLIIAVVTSSYYVVTLGPNYEPVEQVNHAELVAKNSDRRQFVDNYRPEEDLAGYLGFANSIFEQLLVIDEPRLVALEEKDWPTYASLTAQNYDALNGMISPMTEGLLRYNRKYFKYGQPATYSNLEAYYGYHMTARRYEGYVTFKNKLNQNVLEERTAIQHIARLFSQGLPYFLLLLAIFLLVDLISKDFRHPTVLFGFPISTTRKLGIKYVIGLLSFLGITLLGLGIIYIGIGLQFGFGSLSLALPVNQKTQAIQAFLPIWQYIGQNLILLVLQVSLFYWAFALITLIFRLEFLNLIFGLGYLVADRFYYGRGKSFFIDYSSLPFSYVRTGNVLSGYDNFFYVSQDLQYNFTNGLITLGSFLLITITLTILWTKRRRFRSL